MANLLESSEKIINAKNIYKILSVVLILLLAYISYLIYKKYLINKVIDKFIKNFILIDATAKEMLTTDPIATLEFRLKYESYLKAASLKTINGLLEMSDEQLQTILKKKLKNG